MFGFPAKQFSSFKMALKSKINGRSLMKTGLSFHKETLTLHDILRSSNNEEKAQYKSITF